MAITVQMSDLLSLASPNRPANRKHFVLRGQRFEVTQGTAPGDIGSTLVVCEIPQRGRYLPHMSWLGWTAFGAGATLSLGWRAYTLPDGSQVAASVAGLGGPLSVAAAGTAQLNTLTGAPSEKEFPVEVVLVLTVGGAVIPAAANVGGEICYGFAS